MIAKFYRRENYTALLDPKKWNMEGKSAVHPEGTAANNQEKITTKRLEKRKIHANKLHMYLGNTKEDRM